MVNIPYQGSAPSVRALLGGEVDLLIDSLSVLLPAYRGGLAKVLAVGAPARLAEMPGVPTLEEVGLANMEFVNWFWPPFVRLQIVKSGDFPSLAE
jgi:tripartite-type tricarboxylate transporter receptor subunit TctC